MPRGDGTGPVGMGPMTGRGAGFYAGVVNRGFGFGCGRGFGRRQAGFGYPVVGGYPTGKEELKARAKLLEAQLEQINEQLGKDEA